MPLLFFLLLLCLRVLKKEFRERERERVVLFSCCLIFVEDFFSRLALFLITFFTFLVVDSPNKNTHNNTHLTKETR